MVRGRRGSDRRGLYDVLPSGMVSRERMVDAQHRRLRRQSADTVSSMILRDARILMSVLGLPIEG